MTDPPPFKGFRPYGCLGPEREPVLLHLEEFEAIRLLDYENLYQQEAAEVMHVSRPTVTRIYESARKKVATAFSEGRSLVIEGDKVYFDSHWLHCLNCRSTFNNPAGGLTMHACPLCGSDQIGSALEAFHSPDEKEKSQVFEMHVK